MQHFLMIMLRSTIKSYKLTIELKNATQNTNQWQIKLEWSQKVSLMALE